MERKRARKLLLVEDEAIIALSQKMTLEKAGYRVTTVHTGEKAVDVAARDHEIDLILMDIDLGPGISGDQAAEQILQTRHVPIVFLTSHTEREYVERVKKITRYGYVIKNSGEFVLWDAIEVAFELFEANHRFERANTELTVANEQLERFFSVNLDLLCIADTEGNFVKVNAVWEEIFGYSVDELKRSKFLDFVHPEDMDSTVEAMERLSKQEKLINFVNRYRSKDGSYRFIEWRSHPSGNLIYAAARDVTDRVESENALRESEEAYRNLFERAPMGIFRTDSFGKPLVVNAAMAQILGLDTPEQALEYYTDLGSQLYLRPERRKEFINTLQEYGYVQDFEYQAVRPDGKRIWLSMNARKSSTPRTDGFVIEGFTVDITERMKAREAIETSESRFRGFVESAPYAIFVQTRGVFAYVNPAALELFGATRPEELIDTPVADRIQENDRESVQRRIDKLDEERTPVPRVEETCLKLDGTEVPAEVSAAPFEYQGERGALVFARSVEHEKTLERKQQHAAEEYETVFNGTRDAMFLIAVNIDVEDETFTYIRNNRAHQALTGLGISEIRGKTPKQLLGKDVGEVVQARYERCTRAREAISYEETMSLPGGERTCETTLTPILRDGRVEQIVGSSRDVTDRKNSEAAVKQYAHWLRLTVAAANMAWWQLDIKTGTVSFDEQNTGMLGYSSKGFDHYETFITLLHPEDSRNAAEAMRKYLCGEAERYEAEYRIRKKSGEYLWFHDVGAVIQRSGDGSPVRVAGVLMDITDRKRDREHIEELLGEKELLLKEVHHRIKNNMHTMMSLLSLEGQSTEDPRVAEALMDARSKLQSMEVLYEKLYRSGQYQEMPLSEYLPPLIDDMVGMSPKSSKLKLAVDVEPIRLDVRSLFSIGLIVTELITNALKHGFRRRETGTISVSVTRSNGWVTLSVADDGTGPSGDVEAGTTEGFGIALIKALADQLGGSFRIESDHGTRGVVQFPVQP